MDLSSFHLLNQDEIRELDDEVLYELERLIWKNWQRLDNERDRRKIYKTEADP